MTPITTTPYLDGKRRLPAGAVPLVTDQDGTCICQTPPGIWIRWQPGHEETEIDVLPARIQTDVLLCLIRHFKGRSKMAKALDVNPRTIDSWRRCVQTLPVRVAHQIAQTLQ